MATLTGSRVSVTQAATVIAAADQQVVTVKNLDGSAAISLGGDDTVTFAGGFPLAAGASVTLEFKGARGAVYGIADTGVTVVVGVLKTNVQ
jgi:hypothetical protein